jgi:UDP-N-acetylmuramoylalanine--D-glutamate ligase
MTPATTFAGKSVALFGLGASGIAAAKSLVAGGANVSCWDDGEAARAKAAGEGLSVVDLQAADFAGFSSLVLSPGVPLTHPEPHWAAAKATAAGVEIIGDIEIFCRERAAIAPEAPLVAITGTNGKSTTTALIAHILKSAGRAVAMGGNIGEPVLSLPPPSESICHVLEVSSYQIDLAPSLAASIGILTNITPDHIDRHGTLQNYAAIKERLVAQAETSLVSVDDKLCLEIGKRLFEAGKDSDPVSAQRKLGFGIFAEDGKVFSKEGDEPELLIGDIAKVSSLRGKHNLQNAAFAAGTCWRLGLEPADIQQGLATYRALPHRMQEIGKVGRVVFINDSKATNADSTRGALSGEGIYWIAGGKAKEHGIEPLRLQFPAVAKAFLIGEAADTFAATLKGMVSYDRVGTLENAVAAAYRDAARSRHANPVVLLSPACASFDQFTSFEHRGNRFREIVAALPGFEPAPEG